MSKTKYLSFLLFTLLFTNAMSQDIFSNEYTDSLWNITVRPYLEEPLWKTTTSYNAGHFLMLPMYVAFENNDTLWKKDFANHFKRYVDSGSNDMGKTLLYKIQYYYLASEYLNLCHQYGEDSLIPPRLYEIVYTQLNNTWLKDKIWNWRHSNYKKTSFRNMRSKVVWKLYNNAIKERTFQTCILDEEFFTIAIAANLKRYLKTTSNTNDGLLDDVVQIGYEAYKKRIEFNSSGGWIIQPGYWANYYDFLYAGNPTIKDSLEKKPITNIAEDFSHSMRYPCWINSMMHAYDTSSEQYNYFKNLKIGLATQLFTKIIVAPSDTFPEYQATNYMDGNNGVYRFQYNGRKGGIGPFQLSGALQLGWYSFLDSKRMNTITEHIATTSNLGKLNKYYLYKSINESTFKYLICILATKRNVNFD